MKLREKFDSLEPGRKKIVIWSVIGIVILAVTMIGYNSRSRRIQHMKVARQEKTRSIQIDPDLIQKTMLGEQRRQLEEMRKEIEALKHAARRSQAKEITDQEAKEVTDQEKLPEIPTADQVVAKSTPPPPPPEEEKETRWPMPITSGATAPPPPAKKPRMIGDITILTNQDVATKEETKKKGRTVYLPPSFMEARLLTGFDASTSGAGKRNPEPLLLRIQTPAVLPNDVKAELEGCFMIAEAVGRLDKERADVRLVSLSCLSNQGRAVIDTKIKGFVTDSDSKVGLSGRVVSRMGASAARAVIAGFFGGMGDMLKATATTQSVSPLGTTTSVDTSQIAKYSLGGGLSEGANSLRDFYLTLAKQATPVIEVGAAKKVTVVVSEGKELEIREIENDETL